MSSGKPLHVIEDADEEDKFMMNTGQKRVLDNLSAKKI